MRKLQKNGILCKRSLKNKTKKSIGYTFNFISAKMQGILSGEKNVFLINYLYEKWTLNACEIFFEKIVDIKIEKTNFARERRKIKKIGFLKFGYYVLVDVGRGSKLWQALSSHLPICFCVFFFSFCAFFSHEMLV